MKKKLSRRFLLKGLTLSAAAPVVLPSAVFAKNVIGPNDKIVIAGIGMGVMGRGDLRGVLHKKGTQVVAVCDVDRRHALEAKKMVDWKNGNKDCQIYSDYRELLERPDLDAVVMALPDHWHAKIAVDCVNRGLHVYGEKPLARTIRESRAIRDAVAMQGVTWQTGSQQRSSWEFYRAAMLVRNGRLGKVNYAEVGLPGGSPLPVRQAKLLPVPKELNWDMWLGPAPWRPYMDFGQGDCHRTWRSFLDYSGGTLTDWAGHHVDCCHWGLGLELTGPIYVETLSKFSRGGIYDVPYWYRIQCKYRDGREILVANPGELQHGTGVTFYGEYGWLHVDRGVLQASNPAILNERIGPEEVRLYRSNEHRQNFLDCIRSGKATVAPAAIAHRSISVAFLGEISMLLGRPVNWEPDKEQFVDDPDAERLISRPMRSPWQV